MEGNTVRKYTPLETHQIREKLAKFKPNFTVIRVMQREGIGEPEVFEGRYIGIQNIGAEVFMINSAMDGELSFAVSRHAGIVELEMIRPF